MSTLNRNFVDKYKVKDRKQIEKDIMQWQADILNGDDSAVRLTDFPLLVHKASGKVAVNPPDSFVHKIQGYQIVSIGRRSTRLVSIYSPLAKCMIGTYDFVRTFGSGVIPFHRFGELNLAVHEIGLDPLDDDTTKRLLLAGGADHHHPYLTRLCLEKRGSNTATLHARQLCRAHKMEDPLLAVVGLINSLPTQERKRILDVYDSYGTINTLVGDALNHLDKFRTL